MTNDNQAVVETTDAPGEPVAEGASAQDELDTLLGEFTTEPEPTAAPVADSSADATKLDEVHAMLRDTQAREENRVTEQRITESVKSFKEASGVPLTDEMAETLLHGKAAQDPRFLQAFKDADKNPAAWNKVVTAFAKSHASQLAKMPDADATADQDALVAAVQSATTKAPMAEELTDKAIASMSTADFNDLQRKMGVNP